MSAAGHPFADSRQIVQDALDSDVGLALQKRFPQLATVALAYYRDTVREDIRHRDPADVLGAVVSQMEFSEQRAAGAQPNRPAVRVFTPTVDQDGWTCEHTVVEVVADDEPFIVDSVTAALTQANSTIMVTIHPVIEVNEKRESWLHIEIDRETDRAQTQELAQALVNVLGDVSAAVADWKLMVAKAKEVSADLRNGSPAMTAAGISASESGEAAELLQWIADDNFTLLGYREYQLVADGGETALVSVPDSGLGILRGAPQSRKSFDHLPQRVQAKARERTLLVLTKANRRSTVHRPAYLDYVGVKTFDADGNVNGERRFIGLLTAATYANSATQIPVARKTVAAAIEASGFEPGSHSARDLLHFCEIYPRDELFQVTSEQLLDVARHVIAIGERRQTRVFVRDDDYGRFASVLVYLPRDRYTTDVRIDITKILADSYGSEQIDYVARVSDSVLARLHFVVRFAQRQQPLDVDLVALNDRVSAVVESWNDQLAVALVHEFGEERATDVRNEFGQGFPDSYKADVSPRGGAADLARLLALGDDGASVRLHDELGQIPGEHRVTLYSVGRPVELSELLPVFESLGAEVLEERPYEIKRTGGLSAWIYDVGVRLSRDPDVPDDPDFADRFADAFLAIWRGDAEADSLNALISTTDLSWREVSWLRSWVAYARQIGSTFSGPYVERVLRANSAIAVLLIRMFETRLRPVDNPHAEEEWANLNATCLGAIDEVASLDADRILRQLRDIVCAIVRTNAFQTDANGAPRAAVAHKLEPRLIAGIPEPTPKFEIWVCSPRLAGVHLRFGKIARGGLRWSDRPEDMRTEILGLVKAQMVKNSVIVPVGAKGGFFVKNAVDASDRAAWLEQGLACYREFITSLLELTDNRVQGEIVRPAMTTCRDSADPYLVVAADKGTATFSDTANEIAVSHGFWLGDAFASGGSNGYDHKEMGITARGAWESVKRHFRELGVNVAVDEFTVAGIGDMSGDVFGNAMLLSNSLKLVAAFDHRHIFLDPDPDPKASFAERSRLADLDRSSWADYNADLLSEGGGVYERTRKAVPVSPQVARRLDLDESITELTPQELIHHILLAPVDLLFNGGIGTYVKASDETNLDVGDKANDAIRVNGSQLRARVVGEGGNLGLTQAGRIEASRCGVRLNTDAIDNSAGVDCSDHEVNIKILLDQVVAAGDLTTKQRNELLASMTDEVAGLVLAENYRQNLVLMYARSQSDGLLPVHRRLIDDLESRGFIDRELEVIPTDAELAELQAQGFGLTSPELCVLLSWVKIALTQDVTESAIPEEAWFRRYITEYFPERIRDKFVDAIAQHPLRTEIIATLVANDLVDCGGITFMYRACEETGASPVEVVRAYAVAVEVFGLREVWREISALDDEAPTTAAVALHLEVRRLLDRATRWVLALRGGTVDVGAEIAAFHDTVARMADTVDRLLRGDQRERFAARAAEFVALGSPLPLAEKVAGMLDNFSLLDIDDLATRHRESPEAVAALYFAVSDRYKFDEFLIYITELPRQDRWDNLARAAMRSDLYAVLAGLTSKIMRTTDDEASPVERIAAWEEANREGQQRASATLADLAKAGKYDLATLSVALRTLRTLIGQTRGGAED